MLKTILVLGFGAAAIYGWIVNIVVLFHLNEGVGEIVTRAIGVIVPFIGAVLGYI